MKTLAIILMAIGLALMSSGSWAQCYGYGCNSQYQYYENDRAIDRMQQRMDRMQDQANEQLRNFQYQQQMQQMQQQNGDY